MKSYFKSIACLPPLILALTAACGSAPLKPRAASAFAACPAANAGTNQFSATETGSDQTLASPAAPDKSSAPLAESKQLPPPGCAEQTSIYSGAVWLPFFGPLYDAAINSNPGQEPALTVLATVLPGLGPALQLGLGEKICLAECLTEAAPELSDDSLRRAYLEQALQVSDANCRRYVDQLRSADATGGILAEYRLLAVMADAMEANRRQARTILVKDAADAAETRRRVEAYDSLCTLDHAAATLAAATRNQLSGSLTANAADQKMWLAEAGIADTPAPRPVDKNNHINNIHRIGGASNTPGLQELRKQLRERKGERQHSTRRSLRR